MAEEIMAIRFDCPSCKANYEVADDLAGKMIMCRVCKKRGAVRSLTAAASAPGLGGLAAKTSRRNFLPYIAFFLASVGAWWVGALLARYQPWERGRERPEDESGGWRRFRQPGEDKKAGKEGAV
jgi:hypothetical protein